MRLVWRAALLLAVFAGVGWAVARSLMVHEAMRGAPLPEVRLSAAMAGLFAGGAATVVVGLMMLRRR